MENTISRMKNTIEEINHRLNKADDRISDVQYTVAENTQLEQQK